MDHIVAEALIRDLQNELNDFFTRIQGFLREPTVTIISSIVSRWWRMQMQEEIESRIRILILQIITDDGVPVAQVLPNVVYWIQFLFDNAMN